MLVPPRKGARSRRWRRGQGGALSTPPVRPAQAPTHHLQPPQPLLRSEGGAGLRFGTEGSRPRPHRGTVCAEPGSRAYAERSPASPFQRSPHSGTGIPPCRTLSSGRKRVLLDFLSRSPRLLGIVVRGARGQGCLLYTSDAADETSTV